MAIEHVRAMMYQLPFAQRNLGNGGLGHTLCTSDRFRGCKELTFCAHVDYLLQVTQAAYLLRNHSLAVAKVLPPWV